MRFIAILLFVCVAVMLAGCGSTSGYIPLAQDVVLPRLDPDQRLEYYGWLKEGVDDFERKYNTNTGEPLQEAPEVTPSEDDPESEPADTDTEEPEDGDPSEDDADGSNTSE